MNMHMMLALLIGIWGNCTHAQQSLTWDPTHFIASADIENGPLSSTPPAFQKTIDRTRQMRMAHASSRTAHKPVLDSIHKDAKGLYIVERDGSHRHLLEGEHVSIQGSVGVITNNKINYLAEGCVTIDMNGICHINIKNTLHTFKDTEYASRLDGPGVHLFLNNRLHRLHEGEWRISGESHKAYLCLSDAMYSLNQGDFCKNGSSYYIYGINHSIHCLKVGESTIFDNQAFINAGNALIQLNPSQWFDTDTIRYSYDGTDLHIFQRVSFEHILPQGMQHEIIQLLDQKQSLANITNHVNEKVQAILDCAYAGNYYVSHELDWQLQSALKGLPTSSDARYFTFHLATIEHVVHNIHMHAGLRTPQGPSFIDRSSIRLAQAVSKYFEYLAPTENELSLITDCARYICDVSIGTEYLSQETLNKRIDQFWHMLDSLSLSTLSNITADQLIDNTCYVAARATYALGSSATLSILKNIKTASDMFSHAAHRFTNAFDRVIGANPVVIAEDGSVIWNASQEIVAESRQIIQRFDGMKDKPKTRKAPPEILDDAEKVVEGQEKIVPNLPENIRVQLEELRINGKDFRHDVLKPEQHLFSNKHIKGGMLNIGFTESEIMEKVVKIIVDLEKQNRFGQGTNQIITMFGKSAFEIRVEISNNIIRSINGFVGHSSRVFPNRIILF